MNNLKGKKAVFCTLGCKLNFAETSAIRQQMEAAGAEAAGVGEVADICIVNTCSVTEVAESKCRQAISRLRRKHPGSLMVVTGCYAERYRTVAASRQEEGDALLVVSTQQKGDIVKLIEDRLSPTSLSPTLSKGEGVPPPSGDVRRGPFFPACARGERTRYFLKVQDGCDYFCTYCTIPFARGRSRNGSIDSLVRQAEEAAREGGKEIVLTGVNIGDFGRTTGERFIDLLRRLDSVEGIQRYRISSIEPNLLTEDIIRFCAESRAFMPHFHIPLQSGSDEVLRLMHRRYDTAFFAHKIEQVRTYIPDAFIGVDVIAGMRGETDEMFAQALRFMRSLPVSQYHVFTYSERPGTKALAIPGRVSPEKKHERMGHILSLSDEKLRSYYNIYKGQTRPVLIEHSQKAGILHGFTDNYIRVSLPPDLKDKANTIVQVRLGEWDEKGDALTGTAFPEETSK